MDPRSRRAFGFLDGEPTTAWTAFHRSPDCAVLVSEPFAYRRGLRAGSTLELPARGGPHAFPVAGVFADYGSDQGMVVLDRSCFEAHWQASGITSLAVFAEPGTDPEDLGRRLGALPGSEEVEIHPTRSLREASLEIFDRTFAITSVLRLAAVLVALIGLVGALAALELERAPEVALLRALGFTPGQTWALATAQAAFLGLATGLLSVPLGLAQAGLLIHVINRRSFGWTMPMQIDPWICLQALVLGLAAGLLAAVLPAWKSSRAVTARALREE
jgi:putative ABC transport system permease protein